jgi:hypothetical protein
MARRASIPLLRPDRVRSISGTAFGWLDARLLQEGWLAALGAEGTAAYAFLCLAADRQGLSYYRRDRIAHALALSDQALHHALSRLETLDLVAYRPFHRRAADGVRQVLALPAGPPPASGAEAFVLGLAERLGRPPSGEGQPR